MKVLETGKKEKWTKEVVCHGCQSRLEVAIDDIKTNIRSQSKLFWVSCPEDGTQVSVNDISQDIKNTIESRLIKAERERFDLENAAIRKAIDAL